MAGADSTGETMHGQRSVYTATRAQPVVHRKQSGAQREQRRDGETTAHR